MYSCGGLRRPRGDPRAGAADEARADLRRARARPRRPPARDRHRLGRARGPRRRDPGLPGDDDDDLARAARARRRARPRAGARRPGRGAADATIATSAGTYDKLVSIEMIEAVGWQYFRALLRQVRASSPGPSGAMFLQAIVIGDEPTSREGLAQLLQQAHLPRRLPALAGADHAAGRRQRDARRPLPRTSPTATPARWRSGASASTTPGRASAPRGYDERFSRLWNFYLALSEGGFRERRIRDLQMVLAKPGWSATEAMAIAYARSGSGDPLVLIHGLGGSRRIWEPVVDRLAAERDVIAVDLPGFGESAELAPDDGPPTPASLAATVADLCAELGIERPHVAGNSLGGWVALELAKAGSGALGLRDLPGRPLAAAAGAAAGRHPRRGRCGCGRCCRWRSPRRGSRAAAPAHHRRQARAAQPRRGEGADLRLARRPRLRRREPRDALARVRATPSWSRSRRRSPGAPRTGSSRRRGPSGCRPARATSSSRASGTRRPGTTRR